MIHRINKHSFPSDFRLALIPEHLHILWFLLLQEFLYIFEEFKLFELLLFFLLRLRASFDFSKQFLTCVEFNGLVDLEEHLGMPLTDIVSIAVYDLCKFSPDVTLILEQILALTLGWQYRH